MKKKLLKSMRVLLITAGLFAGVNAWADDVVVNIPISQSYNICGTNNYSSQSITQLLITSAGGSYGEAQLEFLLDDNFDVSKVKSASLELYTVSNGTRSEDVKIYSASGLTSNLDKKDCGDAKITSEDGKAKIFSYGSANTRSYGFANSTIIANAAANTFTANAYKSIDITSYIQGLTTKNPGDAIYFGIAATDAKPLALILAGYQHTNASKLVITYTNDVMYNYSIKAVCGQTVLKTYTSGTCTKGTNFSTSLNKILKGDNDKYYVLDDNQTGVTGYEASYTMGDDDGNKEITYTLDESIVWFEEGESNTNGTNLSNAYSGGGCSTYRNANKFNSTTISEPGAYKAELYVAEGIGNGRAFGIFTKEGETYTAVKTISFSSNKTASAGLYTTDIFCVNAGTTLYTGNTANSLGLDYLIIRKVADIVDANNEFLGSFDYTTNYNSSWNTTPVWINAGETANYKFVNHNNTASANLYENWYLFGATEASENVVIFGPNHSNTATNGTYTSKPTFTMADLDGATVELTTTLTKDGETYTLTTTGVTTKADGTTLSPNLVYTQTGLTASKLKLYVSVEKNWLELLAQKVTVPVTNGFATYANHNQALDFSNVEGLTAYTATVSDDVVTFTKATQVPAGTGLLLKGATADVPVIASAAEIDNNALFAPTSAVSGLTYDQNGYYNYILTQPSGKSVGFYRANNNNVAVGKAYLRVSKENNTRRFSFIGLNGETEVTGISQIEDGRLNVENAVFNLNGQRVAEPKSGLYIVNGKKVVIK